jgi:hypothetical protein
MGHGRRINRDIIEEHSGSVRQIENCRRLSMNKKGRSSIKKNKPRVESFQVKERSTMGVLKEIKAQEEGYCSIDHKGSIRIFGINRRIGGELTGIRKEHRQKFQQGWAWA